MTDRAYVRISLDTAASGSIAKQRARLLALAPEAVVYADESVSGSKVSFGDRPAGRRLLADLCAGDRVLVTKIDRAARNVRDLLGLIERIEAAGASIVFADQALDTAGPTGRFMLTLLGAVAELEAAIIAERRRESLAAFRAEGRHAVGRAPYGLESVPNPAGRGLVLRPHPVEAPALRAAVERLYAGASLSALAADLGLLDTHLGRVLRNDRLAGVLSHSPDGPRIDPEAAVFSLAEWTRLRAFLDRRPSPPRSRADGIGAALACGVCGDRLYRNAARNPAHATYRCRGVRHAAGAPRASVIARNAEAEVERVFLERMGHLPMTETLEEHSDAARVEAVAVARMRLEAARRAQDAAETVDEEDAADVAYRAARRALRDAEALPVSALAVVRETGETFADAYLAGDADRRVEVLRLAGRWVVEPGRVPIDRKVRLEPDA